jgi:hypothetical protein
MSNKNTTNITFLYRLTVRKDNNEVIITNIGKENFLALEFDISKEPMGLHNAKITITNLNPNTASIFIKRTNDTFKITVSLDIGILSKGGLGRVFQGTAVEAKVEKSGVNELFVIEALDGSHQTENAIANLKIAENTTFLDIKKQLADRLGMPYVDNGNIEDLQKIQRDLFIDTKNVWSEIQNMFGDQEIYIDNEKLTTVNFDKLKQQKVSNFKTIPSITDEQFIDRPNPQGVYIQCRAELMPFRTKNELIQVQSTHPISKRYNGIYRIIGIVHSGLISKTTIRGIPSTTLTLDRI